MHDDAQKGDGRRGMPREMLTKRECKRVWDNVVPASTMSKAELSEIDGLFMEVMTRRVYPGILLKG